MYTSYEYVIVHKILINQFSRFGRKAKTQTLHFRLPDNKQLFYLQISNKIDLSGIKKGTKLKLHLHVFRRGRSYAPQITVADVKKVEE
jgi:hypothetical protein